MNNDKAGKAEHSIEKYFFRSSAADFLKIPEAPIAYWLSEKVREAFNVPKVAEFFEVKEGLGTRDDPRFLRSFWEVDCFKIRFHPEGSEKWVPTDKAGGFRKWYGSNGTVMNWENDGFEIRNFEKSVPRNTQYFFRDAVSWGKVATGRPSFRLRTAQYAFVDASPSAFGEELNVLLSALNSRAISQLLKIQGSTVNVTVGTAKNLPYIKEIDETVSDDCVALAKRDWDSYETSWDFTTLPLLSPDHRTETLKGAYVRLRAHWQGMVDGMQQLEEENNRTFIDAYGLQDELTPDVPLEEVTLTCNPHYRYGNNKSEEELELLLLADTMRELISYAVGCMFGRYALDKPGLILANQGETVDDYLKQIPEPSFPADDDNVIPMLDGDWFTDDITERFREFLRIAFGEEHYEENLRFVEQALGKDIRKYFLKDFYNDHVRRYKKRPIYWLFSSPKGSFNALIYMHRYQPHTVGTVLEYLRDFKDEKLKARKNHLEAVSISAGASQGEKTKALKEIEKINRILVELDDYERDVLYPLATEQVEIDLDDGVKANYPKFGDALRKITGLSQ